MKRSALFLSMILACAVALAQNGTDDGKGLDRGGDRRSVTLSGVSSGAAMAVQFAVAHSASVVGVGSIAGPGWGCADHHLSDAIDGCMCGRRPLLSKLSHARELARSGTSLFDRLQANRPKALKRWYAFHSKADATVVEKSARESMKFLSNFTGQDHPGEWGDPDYGSDRAAHGILSPEGTDHCTEDGSAPLSPPAPQKATYIRRCRSESTGQVEDNAGKLFLALFGNGGKYDASRRRPVPDAEVWEFDQRALIEAVKQERDIITSDTAIVLVPPIAPYQSRRRENFDMADTGYIYVPPYCRNTARHCRVHIALHGCRQDARTFATKAGYNNWAEEYRVIVVYPAIRPAGRTQSGDEPEGRICPSTAEIENIQWIAGDLWPYEPNERGCWDWWGYLDTGIPEDRYLTKAGPQMKVIKRIVDAVASWEH